jgi:outer membrane immunogenic protein
VNSLRLALLGATFLVGASAFSAANAADVYEKGGSLKDGPVDYRPAISWAGFYAGVNAGGVFSDSIDLSASDGEESGSGDFDVDNTFLVGVHVGYNWQTARNVVLGVEGDISLLGGERDVEFDGEKLGEQDDNWLASIRGRLGYAAGSTLIYATGGVAFLNGDNAPFDDTVTGWVAGGGIEHKFRENWSLGLEGLYYAFEDDTTFEGVDMDYDRDFFTVKARLSYHFGGDRYSEPLK